MSAVLTPLVQESTPDAVADRLREAIIDGRLRPGERLIETELADSFAISRGPIREALRMLGTEGLIELRRNRGAVVRVPTMDDVLEVYAMRQALGAVAIGHAAHLAAADGISLMSARRLLDRMRRPRTRGDALAMVEADLAFQAAVVELGGLPRVSDVMERTANDVRVFVRALPIHYDDADHAALISRHEALLQDLERGDAAAASSSWTSHIRATVAEFMRAVDSDDDSRAFTRPHLRCVLDPDFT